MTDTVIDRNEIKVTRSRAIRGRSVQYVMDYAAARAAGIPDTFGPCASKLAVVRRTPVTFIIWFTPTPCGASDAGHPRPRKQSARLD